MKQLMIEVGRFFFLSDGEVPTEKMQPAVAGMKALHPVCGEVEIVYDAEDGWQFTADLGGHFVGDDFEALSMRPVIDIAKLPSAVRSALKNREIPERDLQFMTGREIFDEYLTWNGVIGYGETFWNNALAILAEEQAVKSVQLQAMARTLPFGLRVSTDGHGGGKIDSDLLKQLSMGDNDAEAEGAAQALERFILALACEGVDVGRLPFRRALESAMENLASSFEWHHEDRLGEEKAPGLADQYREQLQKLCVEWERQKGLFPALANDGWMDLAVREAKTVISNADMYKRIAEDCEAKNSAGAIYYGSIVASKDSEAFLRGLGVELGDYSDDSKAFYARANVDVFEALKDFADFGLSMYRVQDDDLLFTPSLEDPRDYSVDELRAELCRAQFYLNGGNTGAEHSAGWKRYELRMMNAISELGCKPDFVASAPDAASVPLYAFESHDGTWFIADSDDPAENGGRGPTVFAQGLTEENAKYLAVCANAQRAQLMRAREVAPAYLDTA